MSLPHAKRLGARFRASGFFSEGPKYQIDEVFGLGIVGAWAITKVTILILANKPPITVIITLLTKSHDLPSRVSIREVYNHYILPEY